MRSIAVNARFASRPITGVERYAHEVCRCLDDRIIRLEPDKPLRGLAGYMWEQGILPIKAKHADLLWSPANTGPLSLKRQVVTIHDLATIDHPEWFTSAFSAWYGYLLPRLARNAVRVLTISEFSRQRILDRFKVTEEHVIAIPNGVDRGTFFPRDESQILGTLKKYGLDRPYLLTVGSLEFRKNLIRLMQAWQELSSYHHTMCMVVIGAAGPAFRTSVFEHISDSVKFLGYVSDSDLPALYSGALAFVFPSLYEGFGLPVLEAMACGTPVLASNSTSLPYILGDSGLLFDPQDVEAIGWAIQQVIDSSELRKDFSTRGLRRAHAYTWEQTAQSVWDVIGDTGLIN